MTPATSIPAIMKSALRYIEVQRSLESDNEVTRQMAVRILYMHCVMVLRNNYVPRGWF